MWANAQRDGRPAEYRWRPLFNAAKFGRRPILECRAVKLPRCQLQTVECCFEGTKWRIIIVTLLWSEIVGGYNTADTTVEIRA